MKLKQYITEGNKENLLKYNIELSYSDNNDIMEKILKDCGQWLKEAKGYPLYRGTNKTNDKGKAIPRKDRKPLDTPKPIHDYLDEYFVDNFGWKARSEAIFCSNNYGVAEDYGSNVWAVYPADGYKYVYDPKIVDLANYLFENGVSYGKFQSSGGLAGIPSGKDIPYKYLIKNAMENANYTNKNISKLFKQYKGSEIMLKCKYYYYIKVDE